MNAGRELDVLVAEKVMGLDNIRLVEGTHSIYVYDQHYTGIDGCTYDDPTSVPPYSTNIAAAWTVVEKLPGEFRVIRLLPSNKWAVSFNPVMHWATEASMPLAICLAVLKAVGVEP